MKKSFLITFLTVITILTYQHYSVADCDITGMTPGGGDVVVCDTAEPNPDTEGVDLDPVNPNQMTVQDGAGIDTDSGNAINAGGEDDLINIFGSSNPEDIVRAVSTAINAQSGDDEINIDGSLIRSETGNAINLNNGNDTLNINNSRIEAPNSNPINGISGGDIINITNSVISSVIALNTGSGDDTLMLENTELITVKALSVDLSSDNDEMTIKSGVFLSDMINCNTGIDTLIFAMEVPVEQLNRLSGEIALADPAGGSITINGLFYKWEDCEFLVNELVGVRMTRPIPTLSQLGLMVIAGLMGIAGIIVISRRSRASKA